MQKFIIAHQFSDDKEAIYEIIKNFHKYDVVLGNPERNVIKKIPFKEGVIVIKSFKKPHIINKIAYRYFRKSKAERSFKHAQKLLKLGIPTPEPIAYLENYDWMGITSSYYVSNYQPYDFTIREIYKIPDSYECVKAFAQFSYFVHTQGVYIIDNTPGNTLVTRKENGYHMSLVDLNRMEFHDNLSFDIKMKSLSNNLKKQPHLDIFMKEYARVSGYPLKEIKSKIFLHQKEFNRKIASKAKFKKNMGKILPSK